MNAEPRKHHFLPQFYLAGFTASGERNGDLYLIGLDDGRRWKGTPATVGHQRDFYRIDDLDDVDPNEVERILSNIEGDIGTVLRDVLAREQLPEDDEAFSWLINFVALMAARVPRTRSTFGKPMAEAMNKLLRIMVSTPERFASIYDQARRKGADLPANPDYERMRENVEGERYVLELSQGFYIKQLFDIVDTILPLLAQRLWSLLIAEQDCEFIVSDHPVALTWSRPRPPSFYGPGFGLPDTDVTIPLSRRLALLGTFEGPSNRRVVSRRDVAGVNSRTSSYGERFVASSTQDLVWLMPDGTVGNAEQLGQLIRERNH